MTEVDREYLIIPDLDEARAAGELMHGRVRRAQERGETAANYGDIGYANANRILRESPHLAQFLEFMAQNVAAMVDKGTMSPDQAYLNDARDILELLAVATTSSQLPDLGDGEA